MTLKIENLIVSIIVAIFATFSYPIFLEKDNGIFGSVIYLLPSLFLVLLGFIVSLFLAPKNEEVSGQSIKFYQWILANLIDILVFLVVFVISILIIDNFLFLGGVLIFCANWYLIGRNALFPSVGVLLIDLRYTD